MSQLNSNTIHIDDFDYVLPEHLIAQVPAGERTGSRLLTVGADDCTHLRFEDVADLLQAGDILVLNNTKVVKARLFGVKDSGGQAEVLLERILSEHEALCQVRVSKPMLDGRTLSVGQHQLTCLGRQGQFYHLRFSQPVLDVLDEHGETPLPPYIKRDTVVSADEARYQTVYGKVPGAVAAPTAGLHFDTRLLQQLARQGVAITELTLHVGAGTFQPVRGPLRHHVMHKEQYEVSAEAVAAIEQTRQAGGRVVAVGTTVVRTLEALLKDNEGVLRPGTGETQLFIKPGFQFQIVDALITNFHLPRSTLMMLVCAFAGYDRVMNAYRLAVAEQYRFFSYGDAMWLERACTD